MKCHLLAIGFAMISMPLFAQWNAGGGIAFGSEIERIGFTAKATYDINEQWEASGGFTYFIPRDFGTFDWTVWTIDADAHYLKNMSDKFTLYGLAGLNFTNWSIGYVDIGGGFGFPGGGGTNLGVNVGGGSYLNFNDKMKGFAELKYVIGNFDQLVLNAGVLFGL